MGKRFLIPFVLASAIAAQQVVAPTPEPVGSARGEGIGQYNVTQSFETGYRWSAVGGNDGMYRTVVNFGNGLRLLGSNLTVHSQEGHGRYFDEILLNTIGLGNDPYEAAVFRIQKNRLYRYDFSWRMNDYFTPGLTVAGGTHFRNTSRRLQDHDVTLFPQSNFRLRVGYSRVKEDGPALSTAQEFDVNGSGLPVFTDVRRDWNEYRLGFDANVRGFQFTLMHRWDYFKDDSPFRLDQTVGVLNPVDQTVLRQFVRSEPLHGANPGWLGNLFTRRKYWGINARATYVAGRRDFLLNEAASGTSQFGSVASRQIVVGGRAQRPVVAGDFTLSSFPSDKLTLIYSTSVLNNRIDGDSTFTEINTGLNLGTTVNFRFLGIRLVTNSVDAIYQLNPKIGFYGGFHYSDRLIRTEESFSFPELPGPPETERFAVGNQLRSVVAGVRLRPWNPVPLTFNLEGEIGRGNATLSPIDQRDYHLINGRADYRARKLRLSAIYKQNYNVNSTSVLTGFSSKSRNYSANASWSLNDGISLDASYTKLHLDTLSGIAFFAAPGGGRSQLQTGFRSLYLSNLHAAYLGAHFRLSRADLYVGYSLTKDTGDGRSAPFSSLTDPVGGQLESVQTFPLTYQSPMARVSIRLHPKLRWNAGWQYYGYDERFRLFGFNQNFRANTGFTSLLWSF